MGTVQFGDATVRAMEVLVAQSQDGQRVNSVFGEGVNPRLRKLREAFRVLGLPADEFLRHGASRLVYGAKLAEYVREYLLGIEKRPRWIGTRAVSRRRRALAMPVAPEGRALAKPVAPGGRGLAKRVTPGASRGEAGAAAIVEWWLERWVRRRVEREDVLERIAQQTLVRPVRHGARVVLPRDAEQGSLFE